MNNNAKGLAGALVTGIAGIATGYIAGALNNPKPPIYREPDPICGCTHHRSFHDSDGCHAQDTIRSLATQTDPVIEKKRDRETGIEKSKTLVPVSKSYETQIVTCGCKSYDGPDSIQPYIP